MNKISKVLITGGAGFIGSALANSLRELYDVVAVDNLSTGDWGRVSSQIEKINFDFALRPFEELCNLLRGVDYVFHLAAVKLHNEENSNVKIIENNISATNSLIQACTLMGVKKIVFSSSLYAYGHTSFPEMDEGTALVPKTVYGVSKMAGEGLFRSEAQKTGLDYAIARLFFIYGPNQFASGGYKSVIVKNFERLLQGQPAIVNGVGDQVLDYVYLDDCVYYLKGLMFSDFSGVANISTGNGISIIKLVQEMLEITGMGKIEFEAKDWTAGTIRIGNNALITQLFPGYVQTPLRLGLEKTFHHLKRTMGRE